MGKQYRISELMDSYNDNKFLFEQEQGADTEAVLEGVMAKVKPKKRLRLGVKIFTAAALATAVTMTTMAATASTPVREIKLADGGTMILGREDCPYIVDGHGSSLDNVYKEENGRIYFTFEGQHLDITDEIDFDTPFYYRADVVDSLGQNHERWIAVGGIPGYTGMSEIIFDFDGEGHTNISGTGEFKYHQYYIDGEAVTDLGDWGATHAYCDKYPYRYSDFGWFKNVYARFKDYDEQASLDEAKKWRYPHDWEGEMIEEDIPLPEDLMEFVKK